MTSISRCYNLQRVYKPRVKGEQPKRNKPNIYQLMNIYTKCEKKYVVYPYNGIFSVLKRSEIIDTKNMQIKTKQIQKAMN